MPPTLRSLKHRSPLNTSSESFVSTVTSTDPSTITEEKDLKAKIETPHPIKVSKRKKSCKRIKYQKASFDLRAKLVQMVDNEGYSIRQAAKKLSLKYSTAKCIHKLFVEESRLGTTRVSKENLLNSKVDKDGREKSESELETDIGHKRPLTTSVKKIKKDPEEATFTQKVIEEELIVPKQEYDSSLENQNNESSLISEKFRENSFRSHTTKSELKGITTPVSQAKIVSDSVEPLKPEIIRYIPQIYQNILFLIPVKVQGNPENRLSSIDFKPSLFNSSQQSQEITYASCHPSVHLFSQANNPNSASMTGFNLTNNLRTVGMQIP